jgi:hypothetical protein
MSMSEKKRIEMGHVYSVRVGEAWVAARVDKSLGHGRYEGTTVRPDGTGAAVKFATDAVRGQGMPEAAWREKHTPKKEEPKPDVAATVAAVEKGNLAEGVTVPSPRKRKAAGAAKEKAKRPSGLDSAVVVLAEAGKPMNTADIVARMMETGLWKTKGKTPAATIYAAIIREISAKGAESRFRKTERGHFELTEAGKAVA